MIKANSSACTPCTIVLYVFQTGRTASEALSLNLWTDLELNTYCQKDLHDLVDICFLTTYLTLSDGSYLAPDNFYLLGKPKDAPLPKAVTQVCVRPCDVLDHFYI